MVAPGQHDRRVTRFFRIAAAIAFAGVAGDCNRSPTPVPIAADVETNIAIVQDGSSLGEFFCSPPSDAVDAARAAFNAVRSSLMFSGLVDPGTIDGPEIRVCFVTRGLPYAGLSRTNRIWISRATPEGTAIPAQRSSLVHELIHQMIMRSCSAPACAGDSAHALPHWWGKAGIEGQSELLWHASRSCN